MEIGQKIRVLRGNMTQDELSQRSGIDKAIISKIENGKMPGTIESHRKLAKVFGLKLSALYAYLEEEKIDLVEFHAGNSKTDVYQNFLEIITSLPLSKKMLPTCLELKPNEERHLEETLKKAERFIIMLEGEMEVEIEEKIYKLKKDPAAEKGDSIYSNSPERHRLKNTGTTVARALCISSPPVL